MKNLNLIFNFNFNSFNILTFINLKNNNLLFMLYRDLIVKKMGKSKGIIKHN